MMMTTMRKTSSPLVLVLALVAVFLFGMLTVPSHIYADALLLDTMVLFSVVAGIITFMVIEMYALSCFKSFGTAGAYVACMAVSVVCCHIYF